jgi:hypothetical protein
LDAINPSLARYDYRSNLQSMSLEHPADDEAERESGRELVQIGAGSLAAAGGAAGAFLGPVGAIVGAAATPVGGLLVGSAVRAIQRRFLTQNEEDRVGTAFAVALCRIEERRKGGEQPRQDGLFDPDTDPRGLLEGTLRSAARSYDEKKVPFIGAFYASFVFDDGVNVNTAHFLLTLLDRLTYHHLCALAYFGDPSNEAELVQVQLAAEEGSVQASPTLLSELFELANLGLLGAWQGNPKEIRSFGETYATLGGGVPIVARSASLLAPMPLGQVLVEMAELEKIPDADKQEVGAEL